MLVNVRENRIIPQPLSSTYKFYFQSLHQTMMWWFSARPTNIGPINQVRIKDLNKQGQPPDSSAQLSNLLFITQ